MRYVRNKMTNQPPKDIASIMDAINVEFRKLEETLQLPEVRGIQFEVNGTLPPKYKEGDLYYGAAGVFGGQAGLYIRDGSNWRKL